MLASFVRVMTDLLQERWADATTDIIFNLLVQLTLCAQIERLLSTPLYLPLYFLGGLGGNLLGASFSLPGIPSVGASCVAPLKKGLREHALTRTPLVAAPSTRASVLSSSI